MAILQSIKKTFFPSAQEGANRRLATFGTTSKKPAIARAAGIAVLGLPIGRIVKSVATLSRVKGATGIVGAGATSATGVAKSSGFLAKAGGLYERALGNPLGAGGVKGFFGRIAGRTLGGAAVATGASLSESAITGEPPSITPRRLAFGALGFGVGGPIGALAGTFFGAEKKAVEALRKIPIPDFNVNVPPVGDIGYASGETLREFAAGAAEFTQGFGSGVMAPQVTYGISGPSFSVERGNGIPPELWALLVAVLGVAGARAYLKRRKKKKAKKKRKK